MIETTAKQTFEAAAGLKEINSLQRRYFFYRLTLAFEIAVPVSIGILSLASISLVWKWFDFSDAMSCLMG